MVAKSTTKSKIKATTKSKTKNTTKSKIKVVLPKLRETKINYTKVIIISIVMFLILCISVTSAYWVITKKQSTFNLLSTKCFSFSLTDNGNISLTNSMPMSESEALRMTPYTLTITNTCEAPMRYQVVLNVIDETMPLDKIRVKYDNDSSGLVSSQKITESLVDEALDAYELGSGFLTQNNSDSHEIRLWIDGNTTIEDALKSFSAKISIVGSVSPNNANIADNTLAKYIIDQGYNMNTPDFSTQTNSDEGLFQTYDDDGEAYYFRGMPTKNYLSIDGTIFRIVRISGDGTIKFIENTLDTSFTSAYNFGEYNANTEINNSHFDINNTFFYEKMTDYISNRFSTLHNKLEPSFYCNDYSAIDGVMNAYTRVTNNSPSLHCVGNRFKAKYSLLTVDDLMFAGLGNLNFIYNTSRGSGDFSVGEIWTMSAANTDYNYNNMYIMNISGNLSYIPTIAPSPIIKILYSMNKTARRIGGNGTYLSPYTITVSSH